MIPRESLVLHAFAALVPVDASAPVTAAIAGGAVRGGAPAIADRLELELEAPVNADRDRFPRPRAVLRRNAGFALDFGEWGIVRGLPDPLQRAAFSPSTRDERGAAVDRASVPVRGVAWDPAGRWLARRFDVVVARGESRSIGLFPDPARVRRDRAGTLAGRLVLEDGRALPFAHVTVVVAIVGRDPVTLEAQSGRYGEFALPLRRLPELPALTAPHAAELLVRAQAPAAGFDPSALDRRDAIVRHAVDVTRLAAGEVRAGAAFVPALPLALSPGADHRVVADGSPLVVRLP